MCELEFNACSFQMTGLFNLRFLSFCNYDLYNRLTSKNGCVVHEVVL